MKLMGHLNHSVIFVVIYVTYKLSQGFLIQGEVYF